MNKLNMNYPSPEVRSRNLNFSRGLSRRLAFQSLESRELLASDFGVPWPEPRSLAVSFPTDDAQAGAYQNSIRAVFDQVADRKEWQEAVLRAYQTWAVQTNLNIGLVADRGDHFGATGLAQNDPRFGDFRIGAIPQQGVLANAIPFDKNAGSWAGDVLLNTQTNYFLGDWQSGSPIDVPDANEKGPAVELFSVLLHEAGNSLGLADVNRPGTVMHQSYIRPIGALTSTDRSAIRSLYGGARQDIYEPVSNGSRSTASVINQNTTTALTSPTVVSGSLNSSRDVDFYRFSPIRSQEKLTVTLKASGISLLRSAVDVIDSRGNVIASAKADSIFENDLRLEIGSLKDHRTLFVRVAGNGNDVFSIGDYQVLIDYRPESLLPPINATIYDADQDDDDDSPAPFRISETVDQIFAEAGVIDTESGLNNTRASATALSTPPGFLEGTRYETISSLTQNDTDFYSFRTPATPVSLMSVRIETLGSSGLRLHADIYNQQGVRVQAATAIPEADGSVTFQLANPTPAAQYFIRIKAAPGQVRQGNYVVSVDMATQSAPAEVITSGTARRGAVYWSRFEVYKTQLFRWDLRAGSRTANNGVKIEIYDTRNANIVFAMSAVAGTTSVDFTWLQRGEYAVRVQSLGQTGTATANVSYRLRAAGVSDDQGPLPVDPSDPFGGSQPLPQDPYGGADEWISPIPDPYGGNEPFFPDLTDPGMSPTMPYYEPPREDELPWFIDPYYDFYTIV